MARKKSAPKKVYGVMIQVAEEGPMELFLTPDKSEAKSEAKYNETTVVTYVKEA